MGAFARGDVVLFPFPFTDLNNRKLRPCLVLSGEMGQDIILCQITSQRIRRDPYCIELPKDRTVNGTLTIDSYIRANMLFTASAAQIHRKVCELRDDDYVRVVDLIGRIIAK